MLANEPAGSTAAGSLAPNLHLPETFLRTVIEFTASQLPRWRDDPRRSPATAETTLTAQLCGFLNSVTRHAGLDHLFFQTEVPDAVQASRTLDLALVPRGCCLWINGREHSYYDPILPIECKRLPTPDIGKRERREYLHTRKKTTGGIQRFMEGHHGANHEIGAIVGYVQNRDALGWLTTLNHWVRLLAHLSIGKWASADALVQNRHCAMTRVAVARSMHARSGTNPIELWHLLVEM